VVALARGIGQSTIAATASEAISVDDRDRQPSGRPVIPT
jgi:hypothetical protein